MFLLLWSRLWFYYYGRGYGFAAVVSVVTLLLWSRLYVALLLWFDFGLDCGFAAVRAGGCGGPRSNSDDAGGGGSGCCADFWICSDICL